MVNVMLNGQVWINSFKIQVINLISLVETLYNNLNKTNSYTAIIKFHT